MNKKNKPMKYVIVGGVAGGATAAARLRRVDESAEIVMFERGEHISYANCGLPYYIGGTIAGRDRLFVQTPEAFGRRFAIDVRTRSEVVAVDTAAKTVTVRTADGATATERYDKLLLAPGASAVRPPLPGADLPGVFTLRNVADTDRIKAWMDGRRVRSAVVVGGGFIGLEMAENLHDAGAAVSVVEMGDQVMAPLDFSMAALVHEELAARGVGLYLSEAVEAFEPDGDALRVRLRSGRTLAADVVLLSVGVRPETSLAVAAGIRTGEARGIVVDGFMRTSAPDVYAVGDAVEFPHPLTGRPWLNLLAGPANRQARIAADNMALGDTERYEGSVGTSVAKVFGLTVAATGLAAKQLKRDGTPCLTATIHPNSHAGYYPGAAPMALKIVFSPADGRLLGAQIVGTDGVDKRIDELAQVVKHGGGLADLMALEQAYAPPFSSAKDPVAVAGYVGHNILTGRMQPLYWRELAAGVPRGVTLVDVRTPDEFALGALPGAVNVPLDELRERLDELPADGPLWVYCGVGLRGYLASCILRGRGRADVRNLVGGLRTYRAATRSFAGCRAVAPRPEGPDAAGCRPPAAAGGAGRAVVVDACGLACPGPIVKLRQAMGELPEGAALTVVATDPAFPRDAEAWCRSTGHRFAGSMAEGGRFSVRVEKAAPAAPAAAPAAGRAGKTFILFSDDLDKALATFVMANGAAATGAKTTIFFTFWGLNVIKKRRKPAVAKDLFGRLFSLMMPAHSGRLGLSKMNMMGLGARMMRHVMKRRGVDSLETLRTRAMELGVEFIACGMSMDVMGVKPEELLDGVTVGGVATYMERAEAAGVNLFV